ncbi:hypothetical protein D3C78_1330480 [compost metagenome]
MSVTENHPPRLWRDGVSKAVHLRFMALRAAPPVERHATPMALQHATSARMRGYARGSQSKQWPLYTDHHARNWRPDSWAEHTAEGVTQPTAGVDGIVLLDLAQDVHCASRFLLCSSLWRGPGWRHITLCRLAEQPSRRALGSPVDTRKWQIFITANHDPRNPALAHLDP